MTSRRSLSPLVGLGCGLALVTALGVQAHAQELVKNINTVPAGGVGIVTDSDPSGFLVADGHLYFSAATTDTGRELFVIDAPGSDPVLVADLAPGSDDSDPTGLVDLPGDLVAFIASTPTVDRGLFVSDGTEAGTVPLWLGNGPDVVRALTVFQGEAYFFGGDQGGPRGLWKTDGTLPGTVKLEDLQDPTSVSDENIASTDTLLFFATSKFVGPARHWTLSTTDGTPANASLILDVEHSITGGVRELTGAADLVAWSASTTVAGRNLWVSDGAGGGSGMIPLGPVGWASNPSQFTEFEDEIYFTATQPTEFGEIHKTDGTPSGTSLVTSLGNLFAADELTVIGDRLFFTHSLGIAGRELWSTTGAFGAETLYADFFPGDGVLTESSSPQDMVGFGNGVLCSAYTDDTGRELFFSDGTPQNTGLVADIAFSMQSSSPSELVAFGSEVYFAADSVLGIEPWVTDGTTAGTSQVVDLAFVGNDLSSSAGLITPLGDRFVFTADDGIHGDELWVSDGTEAGTQMVVDLTPDGSTFQGFHEIVALGARAIFSHADAFGEELWITDGTEAGTHMVIDLNPNGDSDPQFLTVWRDELYFSADIFATGRELYATDGTAAGTRIVKDIDPGSPDGFPVGGVEHDGLLYFAATRADTGRELWSTDGTTAGTDFVVDLAPGPDPGVVWSGGGAAAVSLGDHLYFQGGDGSGDFELYRTDGTAGGTTLVADIDPAGSSQPSAFVVAADRIVFRARKDLEWNYFGSDGTTVEQLTSAPLDVNTNWLLGSIGDLAIGMVRGKGFSFELLGTNGTAAGTRIIKQIHPDGSQFVNFRAWRATSSPELLFPAGDDVVGSEMWITDGTSAGTFPLMDLNPGPANASPANAERMGDHVYFLAFEPETSWELYRVPIGLFDGWVAEPFGVGCPGSSGVSPTLSASGSAALGDSLVLELDLAAPSSTVTHYLSYSFGAWQFSGCDVYMGAPVFLAAGVTDGDGSSQLTLPIPLNPALQGFEVWIQSAVADPGGSILGAASLTAALELILGS